MPRCQRSSHSGPGLGQIAFDQIAAGVSQIARHLPQSKIAGAKQFVLSHRQAASQLPKRFGESQQRNLTVKLGPAVVAFQPTEHRFKSSDAGCDPGKAVVRTLVCRIDIRQRRLGQFAIALGRAQNMAQINAHAFSNTAAIPWPPPMHIVSRP